MSFSKKYSPISDPDTHVFLTWESGYKNVKLYHSKRVVVHIDEAIKIKKGFVHQDEELSKIEMNFTGRPIQIALVIDDVSYLPVNGPTDIADLGSLSAVFWMLSGFAVIGGFFVLAGLSFNINSPLALIEIIIDVIAVSSYTITAIFIKKGQTWSYFLGTAIFLLFTIFLAIGIFPSVTVLGIVFLIIRIGFLIYLLSYVGRIFAIIGQNKKSMGDEELLDF